MALSPFRPKCPVFIKGCLISLVQSMHTSPSAVQLCSLNKQVLNKYECEPQLGVGLDGM